MGIRASSDWDDEGTDEILASLKIFGKNAVNDSSLCRGLLQLLKFTRRTMSDKILLILPVRAFAGNMNTLLKRGHAHLRPSWPDI